MINWEDCAEVLADHNVPAIDIAHVKDFVSFFTLEDRQIIMEAIIMFPDRVPALVTMIREKISLATHFDPNRARDLLLREQKDLENAQR